MSQVIRKLTDRDIEEICKIIDGWPDNVKLTWDALLRDIDQRLYMSWSRQSLDRYARIKNAFSLKKRNLRRGPITTNDTNPMRADVRAALQRASRLQSENERLNLENNQLLEQFLRWQVNAEARGITVEILNQPLHAIDRGRTRSTRA